MSKDIKVVGKTGGGVDLLGTIVGLATGITPLAALGGADPIVRDPYKYTVEDENGDRRTVTAYDSKELGEKISKGKYDH